MKVALLTKEYPPEVYGGAGIHVEYLARELAAHVDLAVHAFGAPREDPLVAATYRPWEALKAETRHAAALETFSVDLAMAAGVEGADVVHSHTWYANLGGHFAKLVHDIPHVLSTHSLEPLRPWKREQLGGGYALSSFAERTGVLGADAIIAVSNGMRDDVLRAYPECDPDKVRVIYNGIDPDEYAFDADTDVLEARGIDPSRPYVVFVGRITRQKGVVHLLDAGHHLDPEVQLVLCAGAPDTPEIAREMREGFAALDAARDGVVWIEEMLPKPQVIQILSHATAFACPSIYEPFGIVNLEAMACGIPVVASAVGGIPEVVVEGETGHLVSFEPGDDDFGSPADREGFARDLAARLNALASDPDRAKAYGEAGRTRVLEHFSWRAIAQRTAELYAELV